MNKTKGLIVIKCLTGLHIGQGNEGIQIGGIDSPVIKSPSNNLPYIPGSSLKGKLRCLLEVEGKGESGEVYKETSGAINNVFGPTAEYLKANKDNEDFIETPTRAIFRDLKLSADDEQKFLTGIITNEVKTEIKIDRDTGKTVNGALRFIERVPPDVKFVGEVILRHWDEADFKASKALLEQGIQLLNNDYLGGSGSRGYGAVEVTIEWQENA